MNGTLHWTLEDGILTVSGEGDIPYGQFERNSLKEAR